MISKELENAVKEVFETYGELITQGSKKVMELKNKNATGTLSNSFSFNVSGDGNTVTLEINAEEYLKYLENGRQAGKMPPILALVKWIQAKGIEVPSRKPGTRFGGIEANGVISKSGLKRGKPSIIRRNVKVSNERFAYAIAKSIMKRGIMGAGIIKPVIIEIKDELSNKLIEAVTKSIQEDIRDVWKEGQSTDFLSYTMNF